MLPIHIFDANSWVRRALEADQSGLPFRSLITEVNTSPVISVYVWDGKGGNDRRRALYPSYKANRGPMDPGIWASMDLMKELLNHTAAIQITVPGYEGDDVIAALVAVYAPQTSITIFSTDRDLYALCAVPGVRHHLIDMGRHPSAPPELTRLYKATKGDPSDNIPGIKGFGEGAWEKCDKDALLDWYQQGGRLPHPDVVSENFRMSKASANWLVENQALARTFWTIVGFMPPTAEELDCHTLAGKKNPAAVQEILKRYNQ